MDPPKKIAHRRPSGSGPLVMRKPPRPRAARASTNNTISANSVPLSTLTPAPKAQSSRPPGPKIRVPKPSVTKPSAANLSIPSAAEATPPDDETKDWPTFTLTTTKAELRHSLMRIRDSQTVNPTDSQRFVPPVRLQRRAPPKVATWATSHSRALRAQEREAQLKRMAPSKAKPTISKVGKAVDMLRVEEEQPWQLTDATDESEYLGTLEGGLSHGRCAILIPDTDKFRMVLLDRAYKFQRARKPAEWAKNRPKSETAAMPAWLSEKLSADDERHVEVSKNEAALKKMVTVKGSRLREVAPDANDVDYDGEFDDDEPVVLCEGNEEEERLTQKRIQREQMSANVFGSRDERKVDEEEEMAVKQKRIRKNLGKDVLKSLLEKEKNCLYQSDSSCDPHRPSDDEPGTSEENSEEPAKPKPAPKRGRGKSPEPDEVKKTKPKPARKRGRSNGQELGKVKPAKQKPDPKRGRGKSPELGEAELSKPKPAPKRGQAKAPDLGEVEPAKPKPATKRGQGKPTEPREAKSAKPKPAPKRGRPKGPELDDAILVEQQPAPKKGRGKSPDPNNVIAVEKEPAPKRGQEKGPELDKVELVKSKPAPKRGRAKGPELDDVILVEQEPASKKRRGQSPDPHNVVLVEQEPAPKGVPNSKNPDPDKSKPVKRKPVLKRKPESVNPELTEAPATKSITASKRGRRGGASEPEGLMAKNQGSSKNSEPVDVPHITLVPRKKRGRADEEIPESEMPVPKKQKATFGRFDSATPLPRLQDGTTRSKGLVDSKGRDKKTGPTEALPTNPTPGNRYRPWESPESKKPAAKKQKSTSDPPASAAPLTLHGKVTGGPAAIGKQVGPSTAAYKLITDDDLISVLRLKPDGATTKFITDRFKEQILAGRKSEDIVLKSMAASLKRLAVLVKVDGGPTKYKLKVGIV